MKIEFHNNVAFILPTSDVPNYARLMDFAWVGDFLKIQKIQEEIGELEEERARVLGLPITKVLFLHRIKGSYQALQQRASDRLCQYLANPHFWHAQGRDIFADWETASIPVHPLVNYALPSLEEVEAAIRTLPDFGGIDDGERSKRLAKIDAQITKLNTELLDCSPAGLVTRHGDRVTRDLRLEFVLFWEDLQSQLNAPSGPRALELAASPPAEQRAWQLLKLADYVNPEGLRPNPAD